MNTVFTVLWLVCCAPVMGVLGFWVGRCARRTPIIDNSLPWAMRHFQLPQPTRDNSAHNPATESPCCHRDYPCQS
jgi:hypothetical protein